MVFVILTSPQKVNFLERIIYYNNIKGLKADNNEMAYELSMLTGRQREIYLAGLSGIKPKIPTRIDALEEAAKKVLSPENFAFISGGAGREETQNNNRKAFQKWAIVPRVLKDFSEIDTSLNIFGQKHNIPFMLSPLGAQTLAHPDGERAVARAAASEDICMTFSTQASTPMEDVAAVMGDAKRWYQLYWSKSDEFNLSLIRRAEASGCTAILITLDSQMAGWRPRDLDLAFSPFSCYIGLAQYYSDPVALKLLDDIIQEEASGKATLPKPKVNLRLISSLIKMARNYPGNFWSNLFSKRVLKGASVFLSLLGKPSLSWDEIVALKEKTKLPIILKGILHPDDAKLALQYGIDGVMVSTHGGRQLSSCITSLQALKDVAEVVKGKIPILFDSGIQGGDDIFKAIALGADAVLIGRSYVYALAIAGEDGVGELIRNLKAEFEMTMALSGCLTVKDITRDKLRLLEY